MAARIHALAGQAAPPSMRVNVAKLFWPHHTDMPDPTIAVQRVAFGTSGHRGSAFDRSFTAGHVLTITQAICHRRKAQGIGGPLSRPVGRARPPGRQHRQVAPAALTRLRFI